MANDPDPVPDKPADAERDRRWIGWCAGVMPFVCLGGLVAIWPGTETAPGWPAGLPAERRLFLIAGLAGALGGALQMARSYAGHLGRGSWDPRWLPWYRLRIPAGVGLALLFYVALRAGFYTDQATSAGVNPFGVVVLCALAGLFSREALEKLDELFDTLTGRKQDSVTPPRPAPKLPAPAPVPDADQQVTPARANPTPTGPAPTGPAPASQNGAG